MSSSTPLIGIITGSTFEARFGEMHEHWIHEIAKKRADLVVELIDFGNDSPPLPRRANAVGMASRKKQTAQAWVDRFAPLDGLIVVTPEYDHGTNLELKKPSATPTRCWPKADRFVGYGGTGRASNRCAWLRSSCKWSLCATPFT